MNKLALQLAATFVAVATSGSAFADSGFVSPTELILAKPYLEQIQTRNLINQAYFCADPQQKPVSDPAVIASAKSVLAGILQTGAPSYGIMSVNCNSVTSRVSGITEDTCTLRLYGNAKTEQTLTLQFSTHGDGVIVANEVCVDVP